MTNTQTKALAEGSKVIDRDGFQGVITKITEWNGSRWYDVRFPGGEAVRYDHDLSLHPASIALTYAQTGGES